jgi:hypothetical protein
VQRDELSPLQARSFPRINTLLHRYALQQKCLHNKNWLPMTEVDQRLTACPHASFRRPVFAGRAAQEPKNDATGHAVRGLSAAVSR